MTGHKGDDMINSEAMAVMTNDRLGQLLGVSHAMASRLRNGHRLPSVRVMMAVQRELGIPLEDQAKAHAKGAPAYGELMRSAVRARTRRELDDNRRTAAAA